MGHPVVEMGMGCAAAPPKEGLRNEEQRPFFSIPRPSPKRQRSLIHLAIGRGSLPNGGRRANENPFHC